MSTTNEHQEGDTLLDREISAAMKLGLQEPHADFTRELMSVIAEEELAPIPRAVNPARLSWTLVALGVVFLIIALLIPGTSDASTESFSWTGSSIWTIGALGLISLLALTQTKPRFRGL
jgi:hypothetical protein